MPWMLPLGVSCAGIEVGMRVEPQHAQLLATLAADARHRADRADGQRVVAAQQQRQAAVAQFGQHRVVHGLVPGHHFAQVAVAVHRWQPGVGGAGQVAAVEHFGTVLAQRFGQPGHAQGLRAHASAAVAGADVGGRADQAELQGRRHVRCPRRGRRSA